MNLALQQCYNSDVISDKVCCDHLMESKDLHDVRIPEIFNPLNAQLNPICHLLALLGAHHILHVSRIRLKMILTAVNLQSF